MKFIKRFMAVILTISLFAVSVAGCASSKEQASDMLTREEWIAMLTEAYHMDECYNTTPVFADVSTQSEYFVQIQSCAEWEIVDKTSRFYPELTATNLFAIVTAVRAVGLDKVEKTKDAPSLESAEEIADYFLQQTNMKLDMSDDLTAKTAQQILDASLELAAGLVLEQYHDLQYQDGVLEISENDIAIDYEKQTAELHGIQAEAGTVIVVSPSATLPDGLMAKVTSVDGTRISFENAEMEEVIDSLLLYGTYAPEILRVTPLTDGVTAEYGEEASASAAETLGAYTVPKAQTLGLSGSAPSVQSMLKKEIEVEDAVLKLDKKLEENGAQVRINGSVGIKDILVTAELDCSLMKFNKASLQVDSTIAADISVSAKLDRTFKLAKIECRLWKVVGVDFIVSLHIDLNGNISVEFSVENCEGVSYKPDAKPKCFAKFQKPELEAQVQVQASAEPSITAELVIGPWSVTNIGAEVDLNAEAKVLSTEDGLTCTDVKMYVLVSAFVGREAQNGDETLLAKFGVQKNWNIWTKDNTKMKKAWHVENGQVVPACTRGTAQAPSETTEPPVDLEDTGTLSGKICKASDRVSPIASANISAFHNNGTRYSAVSDTEGNYSLTLPAGDYRIEITAAGYIDLTVYASVSVDDNTYMETFLMVSGTAGENGTAAGEIVSALTGSGVESVSLSVRSGWNNTERGDVITSTVTASDGGYSITLPVGNYTLLAEKEGYVSAAINIIIQPGRTDSQNGTITPVISGNKFRIVLTWSENPRDLDSHVEGTLSDESSFHVYFDHKSQDDGDVEVCNLDVDDTTSYGPETITLNATSDAPYYYYIHRYRGLGTLSTSEAKIEVYQSSNLVAEFNVPTNLSDEDYWNVFAIIDGEIVVKNTITSVPDTEYTGE